MIPCSILVRILNFLDLNGFKVMILPFKNPNKIYLFFYIWIFIFFMVDHSLFWNHVFSIFFIGFKIFFLKLKFFCNFLNFLPPFFNVLFIIMSVNFYFVYILLFPVLFSYLYLLLFFSIQSIFLPLIIFYNILFINNKILIKIIKIFIDFIIF